MSRGKVPELISRLLDPWGFELSTRYDDINQPDDRTTPDGQETLQAHHDLPVRQGQVTHSQYSYGG